MKPLILYHGQCTDGFGAAYAVWKRLGDKAEYIPMQHGQEPPEVTGREVTFLDFSFPRPIIQAMQRQAKHLTIVDHHITAAEDLQDLENTTFDMNHSGAVLAWQHFHTTSVPELLLYVEDKDLWNWALPASKEVSAALSSYPMDFTLWDTLQIENLKREGVTLLRYQQQLVDQLLTHTSQLHFAGHVLEVINTPILQSEVANRLAQTNTFGLTWFVHEGDAIVSLRSDSDFDVASLAKQYGGGGHIKASGFRFPIDLNQLFTRAGQQEP